MWDVLGHNQNHPICNHVTNRRRKRLHADRPSFTLCKGRQSGSAGRLLLNSSVDVKDSDNTKVSQLLVALSAHPYKIVSIFLMICALNGRDQLLSRCCRMFWVRREGTTHGLHHERTAQRGIQKRFHVPCRNQIVSTHWHQTGPRACLNLEDVPGRSTTNHALPQQKRSIARYPSASLSPE